MRGCDAIYYVHATYYHLLLTKIEVIFLVDFFVTISFVVFVVRSICGIIFWQRCSTFYRYCSGLPFCGLPHLVRALADIGK